MSELATEKVMELTTNDLSPHLEKNADEAISLAGATEKQVLVKPKKSTRVAAYANLTKINGKLQQQNKEIYQKEQKLGELKQELQECRAFWKGKRRKELQSKIS